jgi:hypothetical protein
MLIFSENGHAMTDTTNKLVKACMTKLLLCACQQ